jgi:hypothetical protein
MPAKANCAPAWVKHMADRSAQNGGSRTATLDVLAGADLSAVSILPRGHQCGLSIPIARRVKHLNTCNRYLLLSEEYKNEQTGSVQ